MRGLEKEKAGWSIRTRMISALVLCISASLLLLGLMVVQLVGERMQDALKSQIRNDLVAKRVSLSDQIENYFAQVRKQLINEAASERVVHALPALVHGYQAYAEQRQSVADDAKRSLSDYYRGDFTHEYENRNQAALSELPALHRIDDNGKLIQFDYIAQNPHPIGKKHRLISSDARTDFDEIHHSFHPETLRFLREFGFYDIFVIDAIHGDVVYSAFKEVDFGTNLLQGPFASSELALAFREARRLPSGQVYLSDFAPYAPSYDEAASFMATPIYIDDELKGVLAFQMPIDQINDLVSQKHQWKSRGLGETGQVFLVGKDQKLRSENRFFIEDKDAFLAKLNRFAPGVAKRVMHKKTTIIEQKIDGQAVKQALEGLSGFAAYVNEFEEDVICSYGPLEIENQTWAILSQLQEQEAYAPVRALRERIMVTTLFVMGLLLCGGVVLGLVLVRGVTRPLEKLTQYTIEVSNGQFLQAPDMEGCREAATLGYHFGLMIEKVSELNERLARKVDEQTEELQKAVIKLEVVNRTDSLTGIYNRRYFETEGDKEVARGQRYQTPLSVVIFDVDHFKRINDNFGHAAGDSVLRRIADHVRGTLRGSDVLARVGGEEFAMLLPGVPFAGAMGLVERIRADIEAMEHRFDGQEVRVTASFGVTSLGEEPLTKLTALMKRADKALYRAKESGRNRCEGFEVAA